MVQNQWDKIKIKEVLKKKGEREREREWEELVKKKNQLEERAINK